MRISTIALGVLVTSMLSVGCGGDDDGGGRNSSTSGSGGTGSGTNSGSGGAGGMAGARATSGGNDTVAGTISLPDDVSDVCAMVAVDDDTTGSNSSARRPDGTYLLSYQLVSGDAFEFSIENVPEGSYYLWGYVDTDASVSDPDGDCVVEGAPASGDYFGYFDTGLREPSAANVDVPVTSGQDHDFALEEFP